VIDYEKLLEGCGLWPMEKWNHFDVVHQPSYDPRHEADHLTLILSHVGNSISGVYAYRKDGSWLYVGKGAPLFSRFRDHYRISYREFSNDSKDKKWHRFWSSHTGPLTIYWTSLERETDRQIVELALTEILQPTFEQFG